MAIIPNVIPKETPEKATLYFVPVPLFVQGALEYVDSKTGKKRFFSVTPILVRDKIEVTDFLSTFKAPYLRDGCVCSSKRAEERTVDLIERHLNDQPFSAYLVRDPEDKLAAMWVIGYDRTKGDLQLSMAVKEEFQNQGIMTGMWRWTVTCLLPFLYQHDVCVKGKPLEEAVLRIETHPDHQIIRKKAQEAGFAFVKTIEVEDFRGKNDGRRDIFQIPVKQFLSSPALSSDDQKE